jgi:hypothetical protein
MSQKACHNLRSPGSLYERFGKITQKYRAIRRYSLQFSIDFSRCDDDDDLIREVKVNLKALKAKGFNLEIPAWHLVAYIRKSWYHRLHTRYVSFSFCYTIN